MSLLLNPPIPSINDTELHWSGLASTAKYLALASLATQLKQPIILITNDLQEAYLAKEALNFFAKEMPIHFFRDWETLPYDHFSAHADIISERLLTLHQLPHLTQGILICALSTSLQRIAPPTYLSQVFALKVQQVISPKALREQLVTAGYRHVGQVMEHGEFSVRGAIIDIFPNGAKEPIRIELLDNEIESLRYFEVDSQISKQKIQSIELLPAHEYPLDEEGIKGFRQRWRDHFPGNPLEAPLYQQISQGESGSGIDYYLPLFFEKMATIFDYLPNNSVLVHFDTLQTALTQIWQELTHRYEQLRHDVLRPILPPRIIALNETDFFASIKPYTKIILHDDIKDTKKGHRHFTLHPLPALDIDRKKEQPLHRLIHFIQNCPENTRILLCAQSSGRRETLLDLLQTASLKPKVLESWVDFLTSHDKINLVVAPIFGGFLTEDIAFLTESDLFGEKIIAHRQQQKRQIDPDLIIRDLAELKKGAPIVHIEHGVGRFLGLEVIKTGELEAEYLALEYADQAKIYVPISSLHLISRYSGGDSENAPLNKLGSTQWQKIKDKIAKQIRDIAAELLDLYSRRQATTGHAFPAVNAEYEAFREAFPFQETLDQRLAIDAVLHDMMQARSMDRLVCGDVGFGKTEVAMQAAFFAANSGKQVVLLVPTTLLANQHYQNFQDRFANWPIKIAVLSRMQSKKEQEDILNGLDSGRIDIIIGTHKLLQSSIQFSDLGLLIVDEEHRFGVKQKEKIKALRANVDILTLTATPIPRTLNMALAGTRDLSIIATPPAKRLAVKTFVCEHKPGIIHEAISREIMRGGQVYFLHNDVATIQATAEKLVEINPEAKVIIAHGQMRERELEKVMFDFYHQKYNVLVCTTIIESGIDIPTANTIIINKADHFGLAQLHQLRGRVGRSHHQAYAYLLAPNKKVLSKDAQKRLEAISSLEDLGIGFTLATHDLEIRGAGQLLGEEQSGQMHEVGFSLYMEMLDQAVNALKKGEEPDIDLHKNLQSDIDLSISTIIPENYVPDVNLRLRLYKRLSLCEEAEQIDSLKAEMIDRFGLLPLQTQHLFELARLRLLIKPLGIKRIELHQKFGSIEFNDKAKKAKIDPMKIISLVQRYPELYQLQGPNKLRFSYLAHHQEADKKLEFIKALLAKF